MVIPAGAPLGLNTDGPIQAVTDGVSSITRALGSLTEDGQMLILSMTFGGQDEADPGTNNYTSTRTLIATRIAGTVQITGGVDNLSVNGAAVQSDTGVIGDEVLFNFAAAGVDDYRHTLQVTSRQHFAAP